MGLVCLCDHPLLPRCAQESWQRGSQVPVHNTLCFVLFERNDEFFKKVLVWKQIDLGLFACGRFI